MTLFQFIFLSLILIFALRQLNRFRSRPAASRIYGLRWVAISLLAFLVIAFPEVSVLIGNVFGITRGADFIVYSSILWLLYAVSKEAEKNEDLEKKLDELTRKIALEKDHAKKNQRK